MLKKVKLLSGLMVIAVGATWLIGSQLSADSATPGTVNDPIVTRSYVDMKVGELQTLVTAMIGSGGDTTSTSTTTETEVANAMSEAEIKAYIDQQLNLRLAAELSGLSAEEPNVERPEASEAMLFAVVEAVNGQRLICGASSEMILRAGQATVIAGSGGDGLADLTSGEDLQGGDMAPKQHHLLVSRDDGRGLLITSEGTSYILVKGDYTLE